MEKQVVAIDANLNDGNGSDSGHVRVFKWDGTAWNQLDQDINGAAAYDQFSLALSLSSDGSTVAVGAENNDDIIHDGGHVRV
jgi:hypothetical protein